MTDWRFGALTGINRRKSLLLVSAVLLDDLVADSILAYRRVLEGQDDARSECSHSHGTASRTATYCQLENGAILCVDVPPFVESDGPIVVRVHFCEESVEALIGDCQSRTAQGGAQFGLRYLAIVVVVDALEKS
jgi:hypothetical protein